MAKHFKVQPGYIVVRGTVVYTLPRNTMSAVS